MQPDEAVTGAESEALWLRRIAGGDRRAFEQLYHAYQRRVAAYLFRLLSDADAAGEVTNDVMVTVWKEAKRFEGRSKPSTWIFGIAHHKALSELRRRGRYPVADLDEAREAPDGGESPEARMTRAELRTTLKRALQQLSAEHRAVIQLTFFQNLSYKEIAAIQGCPVNTVKTRMFHAKKKLQPILERMAIGSNSV